jgi:hypothetical protein
MPKLFVGPMSKNVVDAVLEFRESTGIDVGFIPSRRQIDYDGGYVNKWTTETFSKYVGKRTTIERDHGGPEQGSVPDDGIVSFLEDAKYLDIIHVDPWKKYPAYQDGLKQTILSINEINAKNPAVQFEVGTEEAIRPFNTEEFKTLLKDLKEGLTSEVFSKIKYAVVQSGVGLDLGKQKNTGTFSKNKLTSMVKTCKMFGVLSKEHNGDYLNRKDIEDRFICGLDSINIAPEFGQIETLCYLEKIKNIDKWYNICFKSGKWKKWVTSDFIPENNKETLIRICGHYTFSSSDFLEIKKDIDKIVIDRIKTRLGEILL